MDPSRKSWWGVSQKAQLLHFTEVEPEPIEEDCQGHVPAKAKLKPHSPEAKFTGFPEQHPWWSTEESWKVQMILFSVLKTATMIDCHFPFKAKWCQLLQLFSCIFCLLPTFWGYSKAVSHIAGESKFSVYDRLQNQCFPLFSLEHDWGRKTYTVISRMHGAGWPIIH